MGFKKNTMRPMNSIKKCNETHLLHKLDTSINDPSVVKLALLCWSLSMKQFFILVLKVKV